MITRRGLASALSNRRVAEWVIVERAQELGGVDAARGAVRTEQRRRWSLLVHHDVPAGRGTARVELGSSDGDPREIVGQALDLAAAAVGRPWRSPPPAAPANVVVADDALDRAALADIARELIAALPRPTDATVTATVDVTRERVVLLTHAGFQRTWSETRVRGRALVEHGKRSVEVERSSRLVSALDLGGAVTTAAADLALLATATAPRPGRCSLILRADALLHGDEHGMWRVFADHASAERERQGLARYRLGAPISPGADQIAEPLAIASDGAIDHGLLSAPVADDGAAIRRFALIERGVAVGLGLSMREAARRGGAPNGGVRNLDVSRGTWSGAAPTTRTIDARRLRTLSIDPYTGFASFELAVALDREGSDAQPITGGTIRLDLVAALARARRSSNLISRGAYHGPEAILVDDVELLP